MKQQGSVQTTFLLAVILSLSLLIAWQQGLITRDDSAAPQPSLNNNNSTFTNDAINIVELLDVNYWEARFKVGYQHKAGRNNGYLTVNGELWTPNVGLKTSPGEGSGVSLMSRRYQQVSGYSEENITARMYDPYRSDYNFAKETFPIGLAWPGEEVLPEVKPSVHNQFSDITEVVIYRNVPKYIQFAEKLYQAGFPAAKMTMLLAVCTGCEGGLIYGDDVSEQQLQTVLRVLKEHNFPLETVAYSDELKSMGKIIIGNTPPANVRPLWTNIDALIDPSIDDKQFFEILGFPQQSATERAVKLTAQANSIINEDRMNDLDFARRYLDAAIALDDSYIPAYLASARLIMRTRPFSVTVLTEDVLETARAANQILASAKRIDPEYADTYVLLGYTQAILQDFEAAETSFLRAEELGTEDLWLFNNRALMYRYQNRPDLMIAEYQKVLDEVPQDNPNDRALKSILQKLALAYRDINRIDETFEVFAKQYDFFPDYYESNRDYIKLAIAYGEAEKNVSEIISKYKQRNWDIAYHADSMRDVISAAEFLPDDEDQAARKLARAQINSQIILIVSDLIRGDKGRNAVQTLADANLLDIESIEKTESLILLILTDPDPAVLEFTLELGARVNYFSEEGVSPLILATSFNNESMVKMLLAYGADPELMSVYGYTAIDVAREMGSQELLNILDGQAI